MKTARFAQVVAESGTPEPYTLWMPPEKDATLQRALKQQRVMTVHQSNAGGHKDYGEVGLVADRESTLLVFPKSIAAFEGKRIVGVNYDLLAPVPQQPAKTTQPVGRPEPPPEPEKEPAEKKPAAPVARKAAYGELKIVPRMEPALAKPAKAPQPPKPTKSPEPEPPKVQTRTVRIYGASDRFLHVEGELDGEGGKLNAGSHPKLHRGGYVGTLLLSTGRSGESLHIHAFFDGFWSFALSPGGGEAERLPDWPVRRLWGTEDKYSELVEVDLPGDARCTVVERIES